MSRLTKHVVLLVVLAALASPARSQEVLWSEEFDNGTVADPSVWSHDLGANGWGNRELQDYTQSPDNVRVENGNLVIAAHRTQEGDGEARFTSGRIKTQDKVTFKYGTIEARIRFPNLDEGLWPAFWTLGNNINEVGWPACGELDVVEMGSSFALSEGIVNRRVGSTAHWENLDTKVDYGLTLDADRDLTEDFHVFRMEWTPKLITTFIDDQQIWAFNIEPENCTDCDEFHQPHFLVLNLAIGGSYTGRYAADQITAPLPAELRVDYVRIIDNGHTELGGSAVSTSSTAVDN